LGWYAALVVLMAVALHVTGHSAWWAVPAMTVLPRLGDLSMSWRDAVLAWRLRRRVRRWLEPDRAALRTTAGALRVAWRSRNSRESSPT
jgi:hypothetical protein